MQELIRQKAIELLENGTVDRVLGWKAGTPIDDVLRSAWKWEKKVRGIQ